MVRSVKKTLKVSNKKRMVMKSKTSKKTKKSLSKMMKKKVGGGLPLEYFGGNSGRYSGAPETLGVSAYGQFVPVSQGVASINGMVGPNVGPYPNSTCTQTGGARKKSKSKSKSKGKGKSKSKSLKRK
jgi:hypothetical protein